MQILYQYSSRLRLLNLIIPTPVDFLAFQLTYADVKFPGLVLLTKPCLTYSINTMNTLIIIPTYDEKDNIVPLLHALARLYEKEVEVLVVDDSSPDGTADLAREAAKSIKMPVHVLVRHKKDGLGKAYTAGFEWALEHHYDYVISMDADFSHRPEDVAKLLHAPAEIDVAVGSRYIRGGKVVGWNTKRYLNSKLANFAARIALGLKYKDVTSGFKRYSRAFLQSLDFKQIIASGYAFQVEMILHAVDKKLKLKEVPIVFVDRQVGQSKISGELKRSAKIIWRLFLSRRHLTRSVTARSV